MWLLEPEDPEQIERATRWIDTASFVLFAVVASLAILALITQIGR